MKRRQRGSHRLVTRAALPLSLPYCLLSTSLSPCPANGDDDDEELAGAAGVERADERRLALADAELRGESHVLVLDDRVGALALLAAHARRLDGHLHAEPELVDVDRRLRRRGVDQLH